MTTDHLLRSPVPSPGDLTIAASAAVPGGRHIIGRTDDPEDESLYQYILGEDDTPLDQHVVPTGFDLARGISTGDIVGLGTFLGSMPDTLCFVRSTRDDNRIDIYLTDEPAWPEIEKFVLTFYRRVWPGIPHEVELLSTLIGAYSPDLIGRIETTYQDRSYVLGTLRRMPTGVNAWDEARRAAPAQMYSHTKGVALGQTLRFIHDSMLMAFGYDWVPAESVRQRLTRRLDMFVESAPILAASAPLIREWYALLTGEILVQRVHGNVCLQKLWLEDHHRWLIGGWEGDIRRPMPERITPGCSLEDLATLQRSLFWASEGNGTWCIRTMTSIMEGYGHSLMSPLFFVYVLDKICEEVHTETHCVGGRPQIPLQFLEMFRAAAPPFSIQHSTSEFMRSTP
ncbi:hypothetical protein [Corynebacterium sp.]|uniref:hypothetical protein n=1 Tax=Corynebacterium sp. TaxID=1720 RepID=UPI0026DEB06F|nr:hypothetical protein [Corynebacterium sp.]MDO5512919.1 hypothetical protein [Corynebacterium sp.]